MCSVIKRIQGGLIVSCQALEEEPLHSSFIMAKMARAAQMGGALAIRANSYADIKAIKEEVDLPVIGIIKKNYQGYQPYITPTLEEVIQLVEAGADIIALDATSSTKPKDLSTRELFESIKASFPNQILMADISNASEGIEAAKIGFELVSTTLSGYTQDSPKLEGPDFELINSLKDINVPVIAEGRIATPQEAKEALNSGAYAVVIGAAITRPQLITKKFVDAIHNK